MKRGKAFNSLMLGQLNTGKMDNFLEKHNLQNLTSNEITNLNGTIILEDVNALAKNLPTKRQSLGPCTGLVYCSSAALPLSKCVMLNQVSSFLIFVAT